MSLNNSKLKKIGYTCPKCNKYITSYIDLADLEEKNFPLVITDIHESNEGQHANTLYLDAQFVIRAVEPSDITAHNIDSIDFRPTGEGERLTVSFVPVPKENISLKGLGFLEKTLLSRIDGIKTTQEIAIELKMPEKRVKMLLTKMQASKLIKTIRRIIQ